MRNLRHTLPFFAALIAAACATGAERPQSARTRIAIQSGQWVINGRILFPGTRAEGLLMNVRMVNAVFEDTQRPDFDAAANTGEFIARIPAYQAHGVAAFTFCLQGGMPGYEGAVNSAFNGDGSLRPAYMARVARAIEACDRAGVAVILGCYYQRQCKILKDDAAIRAGVENVARWIGQKGYRHVMLEIANEYPHTGFAARPLIKSLAGEAELIRLARRANPELLVSSSGYGDGVVDDAVARASDFLLIHFNSVKPEGIAACAAKLRQYGKPIVCNEDQDVGPVGARSAEASVAAGVSWGFMEVNVNQSWPFRFDGAADDPAVYNKLKELTHGVPGVLRILSFLQRSPRNTHAPRHLFPADLHARGLRHARRRGRTGLLSAPRRARRLAHPAHRG